MVAQNYEFSTLGAIALSWVKQKINFNVVVPDCLYIMIIIYL